MNSFNSMPRSIPGLILAKRVIGLILVVAVIAAQFTPKLATARMAAAPSDICDSVTEIPAAECRALTALYAATNGPGWTNHTSWGETNLPCSWYGVSCQVGHVVSLYLYTNQLTGALPTELGQLANLEELSLQANQLNGAIPVSLGNLSKLQILDLHSNQLSAVIPPTLGNLSNLKRLLLYSNQLIGVIPALLGNLGNLEELYLHDNRLTGLIPPELSNLTKLKYLYLYSNQLSGAIPSELGTLTNLEELRLHANQLDGSIPPSLGNLSKLQILDLHSNQLSAVIPPTMGSLGNLKRLLLYSNQLVGVIPVSLSNLGNLEELYLHGNRLTGLIPPELSNLTKLKYLYLYSNQLSGAIPSELGNLTNLEELWLHANQLDGSIPTSLGSLTKLQILALHANKLNGVIPSSLGNLSNLKRLLLYSNQLIGVIPVSLGNLSNLEYLALYDNRLTGLIPPELGNLVKLKYLYLFSNQLSGAIPSELGNSTNLEELWLHVNQLDGSIPASLGSLTKLRDLRLAGNKLSGTIPATLGNLSNLTQLELHVNQFSGVIPASLGNLNKLQALYLFSNTLTGSIPPQLGGLANLKYLQLHLNQLAGSIPPELGNLVQLQVLYLQSNALTGPIPPQLGNLGALQDLQLGGNQLSGSIPDALGLLTNLRILHLNNNRLTGSIPASLGKLGNLRWLVLAQNQLAGTIPISLGQLSNLTILRFEGNLLTGPIPFELGSLTNLNTLYLNSNSLTGTVPAILGNLPNIEQIYLGNNNLEGEIPEQFANIGGAYRAQTRRNVNVLLPYNMLWANNPQVQWLLRKGDANWENSQTVPPRDVQAKSVGNTLHLGWTPIKYQGNGYYEARCVSGNTVLTKTTTDKSAASLAFDNVPNGAYACAVRTFTPVLNHLSPYGAPVAVTVGTEAITVSVQDASGNPVRNATVLASRNGQVIATGISLDNGQVAFNQPLQVGDTLVAISRTLTTASPKHPSLATDPAYQAFITSLPITTNGAQPYTITQPGSHSLTVRRQNPLVVHNLRVSMEWSTFDPDPAKRYQTLRELAEAFQKASDHLYNVTDGRMALGTVSIYDDGQQWANADVHVFANNSLVPNAEISGTTQPRAYLSIRAGWDRYQHPVPLNQNDGYKMLVHELGHYLLGLYDSYEGTSTILCTSLMAWPYDGLSSEIFAMRGVLPWLVGSDEDKRCLKTKQWETRGQSDWESIVQLLRDHVGDAQWDAPTSHITATVASALSSATVITSPSGRVTYPISTTQIRVNIPSDKVRIGQPVQAYVIRADGQMVNVGGVNADGVLTLTNTGLELGDKLLLTTPDGQLASLVSASNLSATIPVSVPDALANPTVDIRIADDARAITVTVSNVGANSGVITATVIEAGNEEPYTASVPLQFHNDVFEGVLLFGANPIKQGNIRIEATTLQGDPVLLTTDYAVEGGPGSHIDGRVPRSPDGKFELQIPQSAAGALANIALVVAPIRITGNAPANSTANAITSLNQPEANDAFPSPPTDIVQIGSLYSIRASGGVTGTPAPMELTMIYDPATLGDLSETQLRLFYLDEPLRQWTELTTTLNLRSHVQTHAVSAQVTRFGIFGIFIKTRYALLGDPTAPRQNEFIYALNVAKPVTEALAICAGKYVSVYGYDNGNPSNPWTKFIAGGVLPDYVNTLQSLEPGHAYQIVMKPGQSCVLDFTKPTLANNSPRQVEAFPPATSDPAKLPIRPVTVYGPVLSDTAQLTGACFGDTKIQVVPTQDAQQKPVFNLDIPVNTRIPTTCVVEAVGSSSRVKKQIPAISGAMYRVDMTRYYVYLPLVSRGK